MISGNDLLLQSTHDTHHIDQQLKMSKGQNFLAVHRSQQFLWVFSAFSNSMLFPIHQVYSLTCPCFAQCVHFTHCPRWVWHFMLMKSKHHWDCCCLLHTSLLHIILKKISIATKSLRHINQSCKQKASESISVLFHRVFRMFIGLQLLCVEKETVTHCSKTDIHTKCNIEGRLSTAKLLSKYEFLVYLKTVIHL